MCGAPKASTRQARHSRGTLEARLRGHDGPPDSGDDRPVYTRECVQRNHHRKTRPAAAHVTGIACVLWLSGCVEAGHVPARASTPDSPATNVGTTAPPTTQGQEPVAPAPTQISIAPAAVAATDSAAPAAAAAASAISPRPTAVAAASASGQPNVKVKTPVADATLQPKTTQPKTAVAPAAPLDLAGLKQRLRDTNAIGVFTKLALKNQVDDLLDEFGGFYGGQLKITLPQLRQSYELLVQKVLALLQDSDPPLAKDIAASREAIWGLLADPQKFATL
jgi:hypothetical protein